MSGAHWMEFIANQMGKALTPPLSRKLWPEKKKKATNLALISK